MVCARGANEFVWLDGFLTWNIYTGKIGLLASITEVEYHPVRVIIRLIVNYKLLGYPVFSFFDLSLNFALSLNFVIDYVDARHFYSLSVLNTGQMIKIEPRIFHLDLFIHAIKVVNMSALEQHRRFVT